MRKAVFAAGLGAALIAGMGKAGTPLAMDISIPEEPGLVPITATFPPLSDQAILQRCQGFVRAIAVRDQLARAMGRASFEGFASVSDHLVSVRDDATDGADFMTPYMVAFGPVNPMKTARSGLFRADHKTCSDVFGTSD